MASLLKDKFRESAIVIFKGARSVQRRLLRHTKGQISKDQISSDLANLGIRKGDIVYVASSLSKIGNVPGGASTIVDALIEAVGQEGTLAMPCFYFVNGKMAKALEAGTVFDPQRTPTVVGAIPETFRKRAGTFRSIHPTHSICAIGPKAEWITQGHQDCLTTFGKGTPFAKLVDLNAKVLLLGVDIRVITFYHYFEDITDNFPINPYYDREYHAKVLVNGQVKVLKVKAHKVAETRIDHPQGVHVRKFLMNYLKRKGFLQSGVVGNAKSYVINLQDLMQVLDELLAKNITIYSTESDLNANS